MSTSLSTNTDLIPFSMHLAIVEQYEGEMAEMQVAIQGLMQQLVANQEEIRDIVLQAKNFKAEHQALIEEFKLENQGLHQTLEEMIQKGNIYKAQVDEAQKLITTLNGQIKQLAREIETPDPRVLLGRCYQVFRRPFFIASTLFSLTMLFYKLIHRGSPQTLTSDESIRLVKSFMLAVEIDPARAWELSRIIFETFRR